MSSLIGSIYYLSSPSELPDVQTNGTQVRDKGSAAVSASGHPVLASVSGIYQDQDWNEVNRLIEMATATGMGAATDELSAINRGREKVLIDVRLLGAGVVERNPSMLANVMDEIGKGDATWRMSLLIDAIPRGFRKYPEETVLAVLSLSGLEKERGVSKCVEEFLYRRRFDRAIDLLQYLGPNAERWESVASIAKQIANDPESAIKLSKLLPLEDRKRFLSSVCYENVASGDDFTLRALLPSLDDPQVRQQAISRIAERLIKRNDDKELERFSATLSQADALWLSKSIVKVEAGRPKPPDSRYKVNMDKW